MNVAGELDRRLANIVRIGTIAELDAANARVKVTLGDLKTDWLPWASARAGGDRSWSAPEVGEQVLLFAPSGELAAAVVMGSINQEEHPAPANSGDHTRFQWSDGAFQDYDRAGHHYILDIPAGGDITLHIGSTTLKLEDGKATLTTPELLVQSPTSTFTGLVSIQGGMSVTGGAGDTATISGTLKVTGNTNLAGVTSNGHDVGNTHKHTGVAAGPSLSGMPQ